MVLKVSAIVRVDCVIRNHFNSIWNFLQKKAGTKRLTFKTCNKVFHFGVIKEQLKRGTKIVKANP